MKRDTLNSLERLTIELRELYQSYGYSQFKVGKFEEYDLYARNKNFLMSEQVLTFGDGSGKLLALKPDVTLSVVKNAPDDGRTSKVCYTETVYRVPKHDKGFREITQTGLECIGRVDAFARAEVLALAAKSLAMISERYVLNVSDIGVISGVLAEEPIGDADCARLIAAVGDKNLHEISALCGSIGVSPETERRLRALVSKSGPLLETLALVEEMRLPQGCQSALEELKTIGQMLSLYGAAHVHLDFSVVNDMDYYNGLVFRGFIEGVPSGVLAGGRYDNLLARMGKSGEAIGFAVYVDELARFLEKKPSFDMDALIVYDDETDTAELIRKAETLRRKGLRVRTLREGESDQTGREIYRLNRRAGR